VATGGSGGAHQPLVLDRGDDILVPATTIFGIARVIEQIVPGGGNDCPDTFGNQFILHLKIDGIGWTNLGADPAFPLDKFSAEFRIDFRFFGYGLGKGNVNGRRCAHTVVEIVEGLFARTFLHAKPAAGTFVPLDIGAFPFYPNFVIADVAADALYLGMGV